MDASNYSAGTNTDWKKDLIEKFSSLVYELKETEYLRLTNDNELNHVAIPDMFTFYSELSALKQEIKIQSRINQKSAVDLENSLKVLNEDNMEYGTLLKELSFHKKSKIIEVKRDTEKKILIELIKIRETVINMGSVKADFNDSMNLSPLLVFVKLIKKYENILKSKMIKKKHRRKIKKELKNLEKTSAVYKKYLTKYETYFKKYMILLEKKESDLDLLLAKVDDIFRRFNVQIIGRVGQKFNPGEMKAVAKSNNTGARSGFVTKVIHYGYMIEEKIIHIAEVQVEQ